MIIISDCLAAKLDEGSLKVATNLAIKLKETYPDTKIISYGRKPHFSDRHLPLNKVFLSRRLFSLLNEAAGSILYIPFASNTTASVCRAFILSAFSRQKTSVLFALKYPMNALARFLLRKSRVHVVALSRDSFQEYQSLVGDRAYYLKAGIDTVKFVPVALDRKNELKGMYGIPKDMKVVLHVGHLKTGRNLDILQKIDSQYYVLIVVSSVTEKDAALRERLERRPHTRIIDTYVENIQEVYQLSDVYFFPVMARENCIDIPLSVLEAAACNMPIVTTPYGELRELIHAAGYYLLTSGTESEVASLLEAAMSSQDINTRETVLDYDWQKSVIRLAGMVQ